MIQLKNSAQISTMLEAGRITGEALLLAREHVREGVTTKELDKIVELIKKSDRTATAISGRGCYLGEATDVIITILSKYEAGRLESEIKEMGIDAFIVVSDVSHVYGRYDKHL